MLLEKEMEVIKAALGGVLLSLDVLAFSYLNQQMILGHNNRMRSKAGPFRFPPLASIARYVWMLNRRSRSSDPSSLRSGVCRSRVKPANNVEYLSTLAVN